MFSATSTPLSTKLFEIFVKEEKNLQYLCNRREEREELRSLFIRTTAAVLADEKNYFVKAQSVIEATMTNAE